MDFSNKNLSKSKGPWIVVGLVVAFVALALSIYAVWMVAMPKEEPADASTETSITQQELEAGLDEYGSSIDKLKGEAESTQKALDEQLNRIQLSN